MRDDFYTAASVPVREDIAAAHRRAWQRLARAGNWWTGAEHVAIAMEVRGAASCPLCRERKVALSPYTVSGEHAACTSLPASALDVIHRVITDPGRLTKNWYDGILAAGIGDAAYVEILDVLVTVASIDSFCRGIGIAPLPLPAAIAGVPSRERPAAARDEGAWVPTIPGGQAAATEPGLYAGLRGPVPNVVRALSVVPDAVRQLMDLTAAHYVNLAEMMDLRRGRSLDRRQMELIAGRVSALRQCFY